MNLYLNTTDFSHEEDAYRSVFILSNIEESLMIFIHLASRVYSSVAGECLMITVKQQSD